MAGKTKNSDTSDPDVQTVLDILREFQKEHPKARIDSYRQNPASIRIRVIDSFFQHMDLVERDEYIRKYLNKLPEEVFSQITMIILLTPKEVKKSFANMEFENPVPADL
jgi:stress-induced morphogen